MKILIVHNDYGKYSGEEAVVDKMTAMLGALGHEVAQLRMSTAEARGSLSGKIRTFVSGLYCPSGVRAMREVLRRERPDVVNAHNLYPFISPAALRECRRAGVPVVMTIHNFRLMCPTGLFMRDGRPCELCLERGDEWECVRHNCERSLPKSIAYAARNAVARLARHYRDCVDVFACITDFQRRKLVQSGFPAEKLTVIPNSVEAPADTPTVIPNSVGAPEKKFLSQRGASATQSYVAYSGRISREKGVDMIIEAARRNPDIPFKLAGAVRDRELVDNLPANVELVGYLTGKSLSDFYSGAAFFVMASRWYEGFPMTILEAASHGKAMVGPDHGGFTEIIGRGEAAIGALFPPGDADALEAAVRRLWSDPGEARRLGTTAREKLRAEYSTEVIARKWQRLLTVLTTRREAE